MAKLQSCSCALEDRFHSDQRCVSVLDFPLCTAHQLFPLCRQPVGGWELRLAPPCFQTVLLVYSVATCNPVCQSTQLVYFFLWSQLPTSRERKYRNEFKTEEKVKNWVQGADSDSQLLYFQGSDFINLEGS